MVPSPDFVLKIRQFENIFNEIHQDKINSSAGIIATTIEKIFNRFPTVPLEIIKTYAKTRTFIRIKFLNHQISAEKEAIKLRNAEKRKQFTN
jgi:hypothetical protein